MSLVTRQSKGSKLTIQEMDSNLEYLESLSTDPYLKYVALLSQTGTDDPTAVVLENTIGSITWTRLAPGEYKCTGPINFLINKTFGFIAPNNGGLSSFQFYADGSNEILVITLDSNSLVDELLYNSSIEIRVYP